MPYSRPTAIAAIFAGARSHPRRSRRRDSGKGGRPSWLRASCPCRPCSTGIEPLPIIHGLEGRATGFGDQGPALDTVDVEPAVAVVVEQVTPPTSSRAGGAFEVFPLAEDKVESDGLGVIGEPDLPRSSPVRYRADHVGPTPSATEARRRSDSRLARSSPVQGRGESPGFPTNAPWPPSAMARQRSRESAEIPIRSPTPVRDRPRWSPPPRTRRDGRRAAPGWPSRPARFPSVLAELALTPDELVDRVLGAVDLHCCAPREASGLLEIPRSRAQLGQGVRRAWVWRGWSSTSLADSRRRGLRGSSPRSASQTRRAAIASGGAKFRRDHPAALPGTGRRPLSPSPAPGDLAEPRDRPGDGSRHRFSHPSAAHRRAGRPLRSRPAGRLKLEPDHRSGSARVEEDLPRVDRRRKSSISMPEVLEQLGRSGAPAQAAVRISLTST